MFLYQAEFIYQLGIVSKLTLISVSWLMIYSLMWENILPHSHLLSKFKPFFKTQIRFSLYKIHSNIPASTDHILLWIFFFFAFNDCEDT